MNPNPSFIQVGANAKKCLDADVRLTPLTKMVLIVLWILAGGMVGTYIIDNFVPTFASTSALGIVLLASTGLPIALTWRRPR